MRSLLSFISRPFSNHLRDEGAGRHDDVVAAGALRRDELRDELLVRAERVDGDLRAELRREVRQHLGGVVVAPRVHRQLVFERCRRSRPVPACRRATRTRRGTPHRRLRRRTRGTGGATAHAPGSARRCGSPGCGQGSARPWTGPLGFGLGGSGGRSVDQADATASAVGGSTKPPSAAAASAANTCTDSARHEHHAVSPTASRGASGVGRRAMTEWSEPELHEELHRLAEVRDADDSALGEVRVALGTRRRTARRTRGGSAARAAAPGATAVTGRGGTHQGVRRCRRRRRPP